MILLVQESTVTSSGTKCLFRDTNVDGSLGNPVNFWLPQVWKGIRENKNRQFNRYGRQHAESFNEDVVDPIEGEGDHLFVIKVNEEVNLVIQKIVQ